MSVQTVVHSVAVRFHTAMAEHASLLDKHINMLFIDNTFFDKGCDGFLDKQYAVDATLRIIRALPPSTTVILSLDLLGKEGVGGD